MVSDAKEDSDKKNSNLQQMNKNERTSIGCTGLELSLTNISTVANDTCTHVPFRECNYLMLESDRTLKRCDC